MIMHHSYSGEKVISCKNDIIPNLTPILSTAVCEGLILRAMAAVEGRDGQWSGSRHQDCSNSNLLLMAVSRVSHACEVSTF